MYFDIGEQGDKAAPGNKWGKTLAAKPLMSLVTSKSAMDGKKSLK